MRLTPIQKERLLNRDKPEYANLKRTNDYLVRAALKDFLNLEDVNLILEKLPKEQIEKVLTDEHIDGLLTLAEKLYDSLGPGDGPYYEVPFALQSLKSFERGKKDVAKISSADKRRANRLAVHLNRIGGKDRHGGEIGRREHYYNTYLNMEGMVNRGLKVPYKKKEGKKTDMLSVLDLDSEPK